MKNLKHLFILGLSITLLNISAVNAQETDETQDAPSFNFSGTVDTYFRASFSEDPVAPGTSFANLNGFVADVVLDLEVLMQYLVLLVIPRSL